MNNIHIICIQEFDKELFIALLISMLLDIL